MYKTKAYDAGSATSLQTSAPISRRDPTDRDVQIEILFCGICHSDLHYARDEWHDLMPTIYPYGGYSDSIVLDEGFVLHIPANVNLAGTAPLLCAGITTYSPEPGTPSPPATPPTQPRPEIPPPPDEPTTPVNTVRLRMANPGPVPNKSHAFIVDIYHLYCIIHNQAADRKTAVGHYSQRESRTKSEVEPAALCRRDDPESQHRHSQS